MPDGRRIARQRMESPTEGGTTDGRQRARWRAERSTGGGMLNGRRIVKMRTRRRAECPTEDREPDGGRNAPRKTESSLEGGMPNGRMNDRLRTDGLTQYSTLNGIWSSPDLFLMSERRSKKAPTGPHGPTLSSDVHIDAHLLLSPSSLLRKLGLIN